MTDMTDMTDRTDRTDRTELTELTELTDRSCRRGAGRLDAGAVADLLERLDGWAVVNGRCLRKEYRLDDFAAALAFVNRIGRVAEAECHHPDLTLGWGRVGVELTTHDAGGLTENDFVVAAKCDAAFQP